MQQGKNPISVTSVRLQQSSCAKRSGGQAYRLRLFSLKYKKSLIQLPCIEAAKCWVKNEAPPTKLKTEVVIDEGYHTPQGALRDGCRAMAK
jgi:hypothetical protein